MPRILTSWLPPIFEVLRKGDAITTKHDVIKQYHERSHIVGILETAGLVTVTATRPITCFQATEVFVDRDDDAPMQLLRDRIVAGTTFTTPVHRRRNIVLSWGPNGNGEDQIRYDRLRDEGAP